VPGREGTEDRAGGLLTKKNTTLWGGEINGETRSVIFGKKNGEK